MPFLSLFGMLIALIWPSRFLSCFIFLSLEIPFMSTFLDRLYDSSNVKFQHNVPRIDVLDHLNEAVLIDVVFRWIQISNLLTIL